MHTEAAGAGPLSLRSAMVAARAASARPGGRFVVGVACGFTPLHLPTFIGAYVAERRPDSTVTTVTGTYGDLVAALDDLAADCCDGAIVLVEWPDLDPRLSLRRAGTSPAATLGDLVDSARRRLAAVASRIGAIAADRVVVVSGPTTAFPPYFTSRSDQQGREQIALSELVQVFLTDVAQHERVRVLSPQALASVEPRDRFDIKMHVKADFPYTAEFASVLSRAAVALLDAPPPKKGVITDLDDTLWRGLVGEVGAAGVSWDLDTGGQMHAIYQQCLARLSAAGVLVGVVSKNEQAVVEEALTRADLIAPASGLFPVLASWQPKSQAVAEVLAAWNIGAADVVMIDDSPLELGEISAAFPDMTTLRFAREDPTSVVALVRQLDDLFAKDSESSEDLLRVASLRAKADFDRAQNDTGDYEDFLRDVAATIDIEFGTAHDVPRAFELVNKTNQFNLNGAVPSLSAWRARADRDNAVSMVVHYSDRFGDLGAISVLTGRLTGSTLVVDSWVLSCRAFSRAVENHVLSALVDEYAPEVIEFDYVETAKNKPLRRFLAAAGVDFDTASPAVTADAVCTHPSAKIHTVRTATTSEIA